MNQYTDSYYLVDGLKFDSKIQAAIFATQVNKPMTWYFNTDLFNAYNWTNEPEQTLDQLYDQRAKELRERYDYIILSYSGGSDSHNILMSFIRQGLRIDEIVVNHMTDAWNRFVVLDTRQTASWNTGAEHNLQTIPRLKEVEHLIPGTKITILDLSQNLFDAFTSYGDESWVLSRKEGLNPLNVTRYNYAYFTNIRKQFDKGYKIAMVVGIEKPRTVIENGIFKLYFIDKGVNIVPIDDNFKEYSNSSLEFFYWSKDALDLLCKQAHVLKRFIERDPNRTKLWDKTNLNPDNWRLIQEPMIKPVLYSTWNTTWFQTDKSVSDWNSEFDTWFINGYSDHESHKIWNAGLKFVTDNAKPYLRYRSDDIPDGLKYYLQYHTIGPVAKSV
jgi:hypothetical protein